MRCAPRLPGIACIRVLPGTSTPTRGGVDRRVVRVGDQDWQGLNEAGPDEIRSYEPWQSPREARQPVAPSSPPYRQPREELPDDYDQAQARRVPHQTVIPLSYPNPRPEHKDDIISDDSILAMFGCRASHDLLESRCCPPGTCTRVSKHRIMGLLSAGRGSAVSTSLGLPVADE
jgi:hypothetical protein